MSALKKVEFDSDVELEDFLVEIEILMNFKHPNILSLLEVYVYASKLWMYLELCGGGALDSIMNTLDKPLSESQIRFISHEVLNGLSFLHENLIIHRDMKAGNILLTLAGEVKLADFGVSARLASEKQKRDTFIGTAYWMAPEVIACESFKESPYNWKADVWSFGITVIELAEMRPPHNEINPTRVLLKITKSEPPKLKKPFLWSPEMQDFLTRCLQKDPSQRLECKELLMQPFVRDVCEDDRKHIRILLGELKADVVDTVEDVVDPADMAEVEQEEEVLVLPDSTKITIPLEVVEDEDEGFEADGDNKEEPLMTKDDYRDSEMELEFKPTAISTTEEEKVWDITFIVHLGQQKSVVLSKPSHADPLLLAEIAWSKSSVQSCSTNPNTAIRFKAPVKRSLSCKPSPSPKLTSTLPVADTADSSMNLIKQANLKRRATIAHAPPPATGRLFVFAVSDSSKGGTDPDAITFASTKNETGLPSEKSLSVLRQSSCRFRCTQSPVVIRLNRSKTIKTYYQPDNSPVRCRTELVVPFSPSMQPRVSQLRRRLVDQTSESTYSPRVRQLVGAFTAEIASQIIEEVISSETQQPSAPSCVFEVMRDLSQELQHDNSYTHDNHVFNDADLYKPKSRDTEGDQPHPVADEHVHPQSPASTLNSVTNYPTGTSGRSSVSPKSTSDGRDSALTGQSRTTGLSRNNSAYRTLTRTRRFVVDGKEVTTTSKRIIRVNDNNRKQREEELSKRKAELRAFRMLQKQETRQTRELTMLANQRQELLEGKLSSEFMTLQKNYEQELEVVSKNYRAQMERLEKDHEAETKKLRLDHVKAVQQFKDQLRAEIDTYSRAERKAAKRELQADRETSTFGSSSWSVKSSPPHASQSVDGSSASNIAQRLTVFRETQDTQLNDRITRLIEHYQRRLYSVRMEELVEKQTMRMNYEQDKWKMDQRHMRLRHQLARNRLQDFFTIKRQKLAGLLDLESNELRQTVEREREQLATVHAIERKNQVKNAKIQSKKKVADFQRLLRGEQTVLSPQFRERLREYEDTVRTQMLEEGFQLEQRQRCQQSLLERSILTRLRELEQNHVQKRNELLELEVERLQELDEKHDQELRVYMDSLPRNQALLRNQFAEERAAISHSNGGCCFSDTSRCSTSNANGNRQTAVFQSLHAPFSDSFSNPRQRISVSKIHSASMSPARNRRRSDK
ncbi:Serine/threonine-protein kinase 10 [Fasciolopsis buskii]|uniref:Serine/threonine-protein kinase 10 n=1 Tax=Fasciolopsis buskii TaxID=27845 RepID=A0A8E0RKT8_9TREM|nr:Serine/threonine-protein kinase 10 [Fasciolopsis buski]